MKVERKAKVSVIIPMYNVEKYLYRSVRSLYSQDLKDIELIFVDDCSRDETLNVLSSLLQEYNREDITVRILCHETNQGVAVARNTALDNVVGEYVYYVDADDYIEPDTLSTLYHTAKENDADIVGCDWFLTFEKKERRINQPDVVDGEDAFIKMSKGVMRWNLWMFLVKRSLYEKNKFRFLPHQNMGEDMMIMMKSVLLANKMIMVHRNLYHYVQSNQGSLTKKHSSSIAQIIANAKNIEEFLHLSHRENLIIYMRFLELSLKHPYLISNKTADYELWQITFPQANEFAGKNDEATWYTNMLQIAAKNRVYPILKIYYWMVIRFLYGVVYR